MAALALAALVSALIIVSASSTMAIASCSSSEPPLAWRLSHFLLSSSIATRVAFSWSFTEEPATDSLSVSSTSMRESMPEERPMWRAIISCFIFSMAAFFSAAEAALTSCTAFSIASCISSSVIMPE